MKLKPNEASSLVLISFPMKVYNADQFANPAAIKAMPIAADYKRPYGARLSGPSHAGLGPHTDRLQKVLQERKLSALIFTAAQLETLELAVKPGEDSLDVFAPAWTGRAPTATAAASPREEAEDRNSASAKRLYSVDQLADPAQGFAKAGTFVR